MGKTPHGALAAPGSYFYCVIMEPNKPVEWKQTAAGIWTRVSEEEPPSWRGPARQLPPPMANQLQPRTMRQPPKAKPATVLGRSQVASSAAANRHLN
jgi:hypothetical protein